MHGHGYTPNAYNDPPSGYIPDGQATYPPQPQTYPAAPYFPPPPNGDNNYSYSPRQGNAYPAYNPAEWAQGAPPPQAPPNAAGGAARDLNTPNNAPYPGNPGDQQPPPSGDDGGRRGRGGGADTHDVSAFNNVPGTSAAAAASTFHDVREHDAQDAGMSGNSSLTRPAN